MKSVLTFALAAFISGFLFAQSAQIPEGLHYQAAIRDANGEPMLNQTLSIRTALLNETLGDFGL